MKRAHCLLSAAVLLALGVVGLAVPTREPAPPPAPSVVTEAPAAEPEVVPPVDVTLKRGETLEAALRRGGLERAEAAAVLTRPRAADSWRRSAPCASGSWATAPSWWRSMRGPGARCSRAWPSRKREAARPTSTRPGAR